MSAGWWSQWCLAHCCEGWESLGGGPSYGDQGEARRLNQNEEESSWAQGGFGTFISRALGATSEKAPRVQKGLCRSGANGHPELFSASYDLRELIGCGSSSKCYRCIRRRDGKVFAVKVINFSSLSVKYPNKALRRLFREVRSLQVLNHESIVHMEEFFSADDKLYIVEEYMRGGELYTLILENHGLAEAPARDIFRQLAGALNHMHQKGIIHRDIKPENVLLLKNNDLRVKIIDFGFSRPMKGTHATSFLGTGGFLAPELRLSTSSFKSSQTGFRAGAPKGEDGSPMYTKAVDVWALGCLLFVMLCARMPFDDSLYARPRSEFVLRFHPERTWRNVSAQAKDLIRKMLNPCAVRRITMGEVFAHPWIVRNSSSERKSVPNALSELVQSAMSSASSRGTHMSQQSMLKPDLSVHSSSSHDLVSSGSSASESVLGTGPEDEHHMHLTISDMVDDVDSDEENSFDRIVTVAPTKNRNSPRKQRTLTESSASTNPASVGDQGSCASRSQAVTPSPSDSAGSAHFSWGTGHEEEQKETHEQVSEFII